MCIIVDIKTGERKDKLPFKNCADGSVIYTKSSINRVQQEERNHNIYLAMLYGNNFEREVKLFIQTEDGEKEIKSTIWAKTESNIMLSSGLSIPLYSINAVKVV